jgi:hypothetical protein
MGVRLIKEVMNGAPAELSTSERLLLLVLAEDANDQTRQGWPGIDLLTQRTGLKERGVRAVLARLAERGLECRVPIATDSTGRPLFATHGHRTTYVIPDLRRGHVRAAIRRHDGAALDGRRRHESATKAAQPCHKGGTTMPPFPSDPLRSPHDPRARESEQLRDSQSSNRIDGVDLDGIFNNPADADSIDDVRSRLTCDETTARAVVAAIRRRHQPKNLRAYLRKVPTTDLIAVQAVNSTVAELANGVSSSPRPAWCGKCDESSRLIDVDDWTVTKCPACHPSSIGVAS